MTDKKYQQMISHSKCLFLFLALGAFFMLKTSAFGEFFVPKDPPKAQYIIEGKIHISNQKVTIEGKEQITTQNTSPIPLSVLAIQWNIDSNPSLSIKMNKTLLKILNQKEGISTGSPLFVQLPKAVKRKGKIKLDIEFKYTDTQKDAPDAVDVREWHPVLWWEDISTQDSYKVKMDIPEGYALAISGRLNKKSGFYENNSVTTYFGIVLDKNMKTEQRETEGVQITALFTPEGEECARVCLETAVDAVKFYKEWHGFYPFDFLYIVPGRNVPDGGYPYASGVVVIHGQQKFKDMPLLHWKRITAHEIGHQYWGEYVMSDDYPSSYRHSWLMIGMGICADRAYIVSRNLSKEKYQSYLSRYRKGLEKYYDTTADAPATIIYRQRFDRNNVIIHGKGYSILSALESTIGEDTFEKIYMKCVKDYGGKRLGYRDFWEICEHASGQDLAWFFEQWVRDSKYLCYQIVSQESQKEGDKYITSVTVERKDHSLSMPIPVKAIFEDGSSQLASTNRFLKKSMLVFESPSKVKEVVIDPEHRLPMSKEPLLLQPEHIHYYINILPWTGASDQALEFYRVAVEAKLEDPDLWYREDPDLWYRLGLKLFPEYYQESFDSLKRAIELKPSKYYHFVSLVWMGNIMDAQGQRQEALKYYKKSLHYADNFSTRHSQFGIESNRDWVEQRLQTPYDWSKIIKK